MRKARGQTNSRTLLSWMSKLRDIDRTRRLRTTVRDDSMKRRVHASQGLYCIIHPRPISLDFCILIPTGILLATWHQRTISGCQSLHFIHCLCLRSCPLRYSRCGLEHRTAFPVRALVLHAFMFTDYTTSKTSCLLAPGLTSTYTFPPPPFPPPLSRIPTSLSPFLSIQAHRCLPHLDFVIFLPPSIRTPRKPQRSQLHSIHYNTSLVSMHVQPVP